MPGNVGDKEGPLRLQGGLTLCELRRSGNLLLEHLELIAPGAMHMDGFGVVGCGQAACRALCLYEPASNPAYVREVEFTGRCYDEEQAKS